MGAITESSSWVNAIDIAKVEAATDGMPRAILPSALHGHFAILPAGWLMADDCLWELVATIVTPDPDLMAMLATAPVDTDAHARILAVLS